MRHLLLFSARLVAVVLLDAGGVPVSVTVEGSDMLLELEVSALCIFQSKTVVSRDPVTR
jgi:hypothetical protein